MLTGGSTFNLRHSVETNEDEGGMREEESKSGSQLEVEELVFSSQSLSICWTFTCRVYKKSLVFYNLDWYGYRFWSPVSQVTAHPGTFGPPSHGNWYCGFVLCGFIGKMCFLFILT